MTVSSDTGSDGLTGYRTTGCHPGAWTATRCGLPKTLGMKVSPVQ